MTEISNIQSIRQMEKDAILDPKHVNKIIDILTMMNPVKLGDKVALAALHSLRRVFIHLSENKTLLGDGVDMNDRQKAFQEWSSGQLFAYLESLKELISNCSDGIQEPAVKTILEFVTRAPLFRGRTIGFDIEVFTFIIEGLVYCKKELSAEILIMVRDEVFSKFDCIYYALKIIQNTIQEVKESPSTEAVANVLDLLRVISIPDDADEIVDFLRPISSISTEDNNSTADDQDKDSDVEDNEGESSPTSGKRKESTIKKSAPAKKPRRLTLCEQLRDIDTYKKLFSKAWISVLSLPYSSQQHKIILKHLSDVVITSMSRPILLADYLTKSYEIGGVISVLALGSLFHLILQHNLDYPKFFQSLYKLCSREIFEAKYRSKFMKLLSQSLQSTNLPAYIVAAFIKRLAQLALVVPTPAGFYCIAQIILLLRKHPQCQVLIHRLRNGGASDSKENSLNKAKDSLSTKFEDKFDRFEEELEKCNAIESSLWEIEILQYHHMHGIATLAKSLESPSSTSLGVDGTYINIQDFIDRNYSDLIDDELKGIKNRSALAHVYPTSLIPATSAIGAAFD